VLVDHVTFHGFHQTDGVSHVDCLHVWGTVGLQIRNSRFVDCEHFDILFNKSGASPSPSHVVIENNVLDCCRSGFYSIYLGDQHGETWSDFLVRNNSSDKPFGIGPANVTIDRIRWIGNIAPRLDGCGRLGVSAAYNVWTTGPACGSHALVAPVPFRNPRVGDFRFSRSAPAVDRGDPESFPPTDILGHRRPRGLAPDAGAYEVR
jgi:hypothetical protein